MRLITTIVFWSFLVVSVFIGGLYLYLRNADLNAYEEQIEAALTDLIGHEVDFDGLFELRFGRVTTVTAENVSLRNRSRASGQASGQKIVSVGRIFVAARTWSFLFGPVIIEELSIADLDVQLERDEAGAANWIPARAAGESERGSDGRFNPNAVVVKQLELASGRLSLRDPARPRTIDVLVSSLTIEPDAEAMLDIDLEGTINDYALVAQGRIGTLEKLIRGDDVTADLEVTLGQMQLSLVGSVEDLGRLRGVRLESRIHGPAAERFIENLALPPFAEGAYDVSMSIQPEGGEHHVNLEGDVGLIELFADGDVGDFLEPDEIALDFRFAGPESAYIASLFGIDDATRAAFNVNGGFRRERRRYEFIDTEIALGRGRIGVDGWIEQTRGVPDMDLTIAAAGPNLAVFDALVDVDGIPAEPFDVSGRVQKNGDFWRFDDIHAEIGAIRIDASGESGGRGNPDNRITFRATGPDVSALAELLDLQGVAANPFDVTAELRSAPGGIRIQAATGVVGDSRVVADGVVNLDADLAGSDLRVRVRGSDLGNIGVLTGVPHLPAGAFDARGRVRIDNRRVRLEDFTATVGELGATLDGHVVRDSEPSQVAFDVSVDGPDIAGSLPYEPFVRLPGQAFSVRGRVDANGADLDFTDFNIDVGALHVLVDGAVDTAKLLQSDEFRVSVSAPDTAVLRGLTGLESLPEGAFSLQGKLDTTARTIRVSNGSLSLGDYRLDVDGEIGRSRPYFGDDIGITASGPSLRELGVIFGYANFAPLPFDLVVRFDGTETGFNADTFEFRVGDSALQGKMVADLSGEKPDISVDLSSTLLDLRHAQKILTGGEEGDEETTETASDATDRVFSAEPLRLHVLDDANVEFELTADQIRLMSGELSDFELLLKVLDGELTIDPVSFTQREGAMRGRLRLFPIDNVYGLDVSLDIDGVRPHVLAAPGQDPMDIPPADIELSLHGQGNSVAEFVGSSDGYVFVFQDKGRVAMLGRGLMFQDLVSGIVRTLNPLSTRRTYTNLDCGILNIDVENGLAAIRNLAMQTDRVTIIGSGSINLANERLNMSIRTKSREGIGVSVGSVMNSFLRVGGTIGQPSIEIDPTSSVTTTGAAVATGGLSLLARGLWDRLSAEADMCKSLPRTRREE